MDYQFSRFAWDSQRDVVPDRLDAAGFRVVRKSSDSLITRGRLLGRSAYVHAQFDGSGLTAISVALDVDVADDVFLVFDDFADGLAYKYGDRESEDVTTRHWGRAMIPGESSILAFVDEDSWEAIDVVYSSPRRNAEIRDRIQREQDERHQEINDVF